MKRLIVPLSLLLLGGVAGAQDRVPDEEARKLARLLVEAAKKAKPPIATEVDADNPYAKRKDEYGAVVLPDKRLSAQRLANVGKEEVVPVGQLWLRNLGPVVDGKVLSSKQLQMIPVQHKDQQYTLTLCYLGVQK